MQIRIDVPKADLMVTAHPTAERRTVANDERRIRTLVERLSSAAPKLIVLEATAGYEPCSARPAGLPVVVANPRQVRDFVKATGQFAKTDRIDADFLVLFAERVHPTARLLPDAETQEIDALLSWRWQLLDMLGAERKRLGQVFGKGKPRVKKSLKAHTTYLERELRIADTDLGDIARHSPVWREWDDLLRSVPGVWPVLSLTMLADLPELVHLPRREIAKLVGIAPLTRDSGTMRGRRFVQGDRASVRAVLHTGALVAAKRNVIIRAFYQQLLAGGKPKKLALVACMRTLLTILNTIIRTGQRWSPGRAAALIPA